MVKLLKNFRAWNFKNLKTSQGFLIVPEILTIDLGRTVQRTFNKKFYLDQFSIVAFDNFLGL